MKTNIKNIVLVIAVCTLFTGIILTSCNSPAKKVENAQEDVDKANKELEEANQAYLKDIDNYRKENDAKIAANTKSLEEFNARMKTEKKEARAEYAEKIAALDKKNTDMKRRMDDYVIEGKENWEVFKAEFSRDMNELGTAVKDLTVKNNK
jgi:predicted  nucleic acid-binding Zn-ribbon protein